MKSTTTPAAGGAAKPQFRGLPSDQQEALMDGSASYDTIAVSAPPARVITATSSGDAASSVKRGSIQSASGGGGGFNVSFEMAEMRSEASSESGEGDTSTDEEGDEEDSDGSSSASLGESTDADEDTLQSTKTGLEKLLGRTSGSQKDHQQEVVIKHLINYLHTDMEKRKHMRRLVPYLVFLVLLIILTFFTRLPRGDYSDALKETEEIRKAQRHKVLAAAHTREEMWSWLYDTTHKLLELAPAQVLVTNGTNVTSWFPNKAVADEAADYAGSGGAAVGLPEDAVCAEEHRGSETLPIGLLMLRQWRVRETPCGSVDGRPSFAITRSDREGLPCVCSHKYSAGEIATHPYGPGGVWRTDSDLGLPEHPLAVTTGHIDYSAVDKQYSQRFSLAETPEDIFRRFDYLKDEGWVDAASRLVALEVLWYNPDSEGFVRSTCHFEMYQAGLGEGGCKTHPPTHLEVFGDDKAATFLTLSIYAFLPVFLYWFGDAVYFRATVHKNFHIYGEFYQAVHIFFLTWLLLVRGRLWQTSSVLTTQYFYQDYLPTERWSVGGATSNDNSEEAGLMFHYFSLYQADWTLYNELLGTVVALSMLRVFQYLQHVQQLNMLSETTRHAASGVSRLAVIFIYCTFAFAVAGAVVFGDEMREFETPSHAMSTLLRMFFMEHEPNYEQIKEKQPVWAPLYFVAFFILCYFMLLNMVLAVIVSSFAQVQEMQENARKQIELREDQVCEQEIYDLRSGSGKKRGEYLSRQDRATRWVQGFTRRVTDAKSETERMLRRENARRKHAVELAKEHCARDLRIPRGMLKQRPQYYNRVSITKQELRKVFEGLLTHEDVEQIFLGVQKKALQEENTHLLMMQALAELALELRSKFALLDGQVQQVEREGGATARSVHAIAAYLGAQGGDMGVLKRVDDINKDLARKLHAARSEAKAAKQAEEAERRARQLDNLNQEKDFLLQRLAEDDARQRAEVESVRRAPTVF